VKGDPTGVAKAFSFITTSMKGVFKDRSEIMGTNYIEEIQGVWRA